MERCGTLAVNLSGTAHELRVRAAEQFSAALDALIASGLSDDQIRTIVGHFNDWCSLYTMANVREVVAEVTGRPA